MSMNWNRRQFLTLMGGSLLLPSACQKVESRPVKRAASFTLFDCLVAYQKPKIGLVPMGIDDRGFFKTPKVRETPDKEATQNVARTAAKKYEYFTIDIEHWKVKLNEHSEEEVRESIDKYLRIMAWMREVAPSLKLGVYGVPPIRDYWTPVNGHPAAMKSWRRINQFLKPIADAADFIAPSLYTFYDRVPGWVKYASANIEEAQQFGKPVYPYLWCRYHGSNRPLRNQFIRGDFWRAQLETVRDRGANGVVLWDWAGHDRPRTYNIDTTQAWWQETVKFKSSL